jgi:hypothetical protein
MNPLSSYRAIIIAVMLVVGPPALAAQSLAGSTSSINRMYRQARAEGFSFFETGASLRRAVNAGALVRLDADGRDIELHEIGYPYVRPATLTFVKRLGAQYREACDESLVITSAARPSTRQPPNATARSVHPTGMAIDLRRPRDRECLRWLRAALLGLERKGLIEATEERSPAHFHVAVFSTPYARYAMSRARSGAVATYVVRAGDTLSDIAREHDVTLKALVRVNGLDDETIVPGQELKIPNG